MATKDIKFQIKGMEVLDISFKHPEKQLPKESIFNFDINLQHKIIGEEKLIIVTAAISVNFDQEEKALGLIKVNYIYKVDNLDDMQIKNSDKYDIPDSFITTLNSISLSTTRGIMYSHFKGTFLHNTILPIVDPGDFKKE